MCAHGVVFVCCCVRVWVLFVFVGTFVCVGPHVSVLACMSVYLAVCVCVVFDGV